MFSHKVAKRGQNEFSGPLGPRDPKSPKGSRKRVEIDCLSNILTLFRLHSGLFRPAKFSDSGTHFGVFFATLGPKGPNDPCSSQAAATGGGIKRGVCKRK